MFNSYEESNSDVEEINDSATNRNNPTARGSPTDRANTTGGASNNDQNSSTDPSPYVVHLLGRPRPGIDGHALPASESRSTQASIYSQLSTYVTPYPRHLPNFRRIRQTQEPLSMGSLLRTTEQTIISQLIANRVRERREVLRNSSQENGVISSSSEESNQSLPEDLAPVRVNTDTVEEPPAKVRKISSPVKTGSPVKDEDSDDGETCPICLDTWNNTGEHRLVALKCGHLFGSECVERWLKAQSSNSRTCPTCKTKAALKDLRCIYARKLITADNSEVTRLKLQVEILQTEKSRIELKLQTANMTQRSLAEQLEDLKNKMAKSQSHSLGPKQEGSVKSYRFALEKNLEIGTDGACRVMDYNCRTYDLYVSQKSSNTLFPGYGVRKVSLVDYTLGQFIHLHPKPIRDVKYSQPKDLLISVSLDKTVKIVERGVANVTLHTGFPLWSCAWDHQQTNEFYVGGVGGQIHHYDLRFPGSTMSRIAANVDLSPVVSLASTEFGLLSCQLNSCRLWESIEGNYVSKLFPVSGSFMSMCYDAGTRKALVSMRPRSAERSKLTVCSLNPTPQGGAYIEVDSFINGSARTSVMSKAAFCKAGDSSWIAAHSESDATLYLHGLDGSRTMSLPAADPALDVCSVQINSVSMLAALSESRLRIYKAVSC